MNRSQLVQHLVLDEICDDYENVDQMILAGVAEQSSKCGLPIKRSEVIDALRDLIRDGLVRAYLLSSREPAMELAGMPALDVVEKDFSTYFYITEKGRALHLSDEIQWPFDDEGTLRPDWHLDPPQS